MFKLLLSLFIAVLLLASGAIAADGKECKRKRDCGRKKCLRLVKCEDGFCKYVPKPAGRACNDADGSKCTVGECDGLGTCKPLPVSCTPRDKCQTATCNPSDGLCDFEEVKCTQPLDLCQVSTCDPKQGCVTGPKTCTQTADKCKKTTGTCSGAGVCSYAPTCAPRNACEATATCLDGACSYTSACPPNPIDPVTKKANLCKVFNTCVPKADGTPDCQYKDAVTCPAPADGKCQSNTCNPDTGKCDLKDLVVCSAPVDKCKQNKCVAGTCVESALTCPAPGLNDLDKLCKQTSCSNGVCGFSPTCTPKDACDKTAICNNANGACSYTSPCDPFFTSNTGVVDKCQALTKCKATPAGPNPYVCDYAPVTCTSDDLCLIPSCDPATGCKKTPKTCENTTDKCKKPTGTCSGGSCTFADVCTLRNACDATVTCNAGTCSYTSACPANPPNAAGKPDLCRVFDTCTVDAAGAKDCKYKDVLAGPPATTCTTVDNKSGVCKSKGGVFGCFAEDK